MKAHAGALVTCLLLIAASCPTRGQTGPRFGQDVRSPEVFPDGRVTFRFRAPHAGEVFVAREEASKLPMRKDDHGVWSATTEPLAPDLYCYRFVVDGVATADPANTMSNPIVTGGFDSILHVPGPSTLSWERNDVPHGAQALYIGLNHPDQFSWVGSFSGAFIMYGQTLSDWFPTNTAAAHASTRLLWISCGTEDFLLNANRRCREWLKTSGFHVTAVETPGAHTWPVWRRNLAAFSPLLFSPHL